MQNAGSREAGLHPQQREAQRGHVRRLAGLVSLVKNYFLTCEVWMYENDTRVDLSGDVVCMLLLCLINTLQQNSSPVYMLAVV